MVRAVIKTHGHDILGRITYLAALGAFRTTGVYMTGSEAIETLTIFALPKLCWNASATTQIVSTSTTKHLILQQ